MHCDLTDTQINNSDFQMVEMRQEMARMQIIINKPHPSLNGVYKSNKSEEQIKVFSWILL
jgi:hypothetical protein